MSQPLLMIDFWSLDNFDWLRHYIINMFDQSRLKLHKLTQSYKLVSCMAINRFKPALNCLLWEKLLYREPKKLLTIRKIKGISYKCLKVTVCNKMVVISQKIDFNYHRYKLKVRISFLGFFFVCLRYRLDQVEDKQERYFCMLHRRRLSV